MREARAEKDHSHGERTFIGPMRFAQDLGLRDGRAAEFHRLKGVARDNQAKFIEPMLLQASDTLPEGAKWSYELKLDGYRALAIKTCGAVRLRSRNDKGFDRAYPAIVTALAGMPDDTVVDGEVVALDGEGRPSFSALQNGAPGARIVYFVFDVLVLGGSNVMEKTLAARRDLLSRAVLPKLADPIREAPRFEATLADLIRAVRDQGLEGLVAKRLDTAYEPGKRSGAWRKMRINKSAEFVIGGYMKGGRTFDAAIFGRYEDGRLLYVARTRNGFTGASRARLMARLRAIEIPECPFANLPEARPGRWGEGLTAEKMKDCVWVRPELVAQVEFVERTPDGHLRHSRFIGVREASGRPDVTRE